jgi:hypothetical protein
MKKILIASVFLASTAWAGSPASTETTVLAEVTILATAVPTAFGTPQVAADPSGKASIFISNTTEQSAECAFNGSITPNVTVLSGSVYYENYAANALRMSQAIGCHRTGTLPTTGSIKIGGTK